MKWVEMKHPVTGGWIRVAESAVPIHEQSGWVVTTSEELKSISASEFVDRYGYDPKVIAEKNQ